MKKDYYEILGVNKGATKEEIQRAFHKLAHKYHPDKRGGDEAKFKEVNEAYQTLADQKKRQQYDLYGSAGAGGFGGGQTGGGFDFNGFDFSGFAQQAGQNGEGFQFDLGDIFGDLFSGGRKQTQRGRDIQVEIAIIFSEAVFGVERKVLLNKLSACETCSGKGSKPGTKLKTCATCNGKGQIRENRRSFLGTFATSRPCPTCHGVGQVPETPCETCKGAGAINRPAEIKIVVPPGINEGEMIRLANQGEAMPGGVAGDLYVRVRVEKHKTLIREGQNLRAHISLKLSEALLGGEEKIETLDGLLTLTVPAGINHGEVLRVRGKGVPDNRGHRGDLLVRVDIAMPAKLSRKAREAIEKLKEEGI
jgi:molecular chaperone DnaJ